MRRLLTLALILGFIFAAYICYTALTLPNVRQALTEGIHPSQTSQILASDGQTVIMSQGKYFHKPLSIHDMPSSLVDSLVATEDRRFYQHFGIDPVGLLRATWVNIRSRGLHEGGSTLTQQLAKNVFLTNERSVERKVKEALLALKLEHQLTKEEILEIYLNNIYFGEGAYGVGAASQIYFGVKPSELRTDQAALLAGLPQAPSRYNPYDNPELAVKRRNEVLWNLVEVGKITKTQFERYKARPLYLNPVGRKLAVSDKAPFFNRYVMKQVQDLMGIDEQVFWQQGLKVYTTLDVDGQQAAASGLYQRMLAAGRSGSQQQAALVSLDNQGRILAYVGGKDFAQSQYDVVSLAQRQAGSSFKVFVYTTAISQGMRPQTVYNDAPFKIDNWEPKNYDRGHRGLMTLAKALTISNNVVASKVARDVGIENVINTAHMMGLTSRFESLPSVALGSGNVNLLEMTGAYSVLCNEGYYIEPYAIEKITDKNGQVLYERLPKKRQVIDRVNRDTIVSMMRGVVKYGTGKAAQLGRFPVAGKTGTSDDYRDAWFIGFTPNVTTGVWVGNLDNSQMPGIAGGGLPAQIWHGYMSKYTAKLSPASFDLSRGLPIKDEDFFNYDPSNLSPTDKDSPVVQTRIEDAFMEENLEGVANTTDNTSPNDPSLDNTVSPDTPEVPSDIQANPEPPTEQTEQ